MSNSKTRKEAAEIALALAVSGKDGRSILRQYTLSKEGDDSLLEHRDDRKDLVADIVADLHYVGDTISDLPGFERLEGALRRYCGDEGFDYEDLKGRGERNAQYELGGAVPRPLIEETKMTDLNINLAFSNHEKHDLETIAEIVRAAVVSALDANGIEPPYVTVSEATPPRVLVTVDGGIASVETVDGAAFVAIADFDGQDDEREKEVILDRFEGSADELEITAERAADRLARYSTAPRP